MMKGKAQCYDNLRDYLETVPLVDCHDHTRDCGPKYTDPISVILGWYFVGDLHSASSDAEIKIIQDLNLSLEERWPVLEKAWKRTCHTGYAQVIKRVLKRFYNIEKLTLKTLKSMEGRLLDFEDEMTFDEVLEETKIIIRLEDIFLEDQTDFKSVLDGSFKLSPRGRLVIPLPVFHEIKKFETVQALALNVNRSISGLEEYLDVCREVFEGFKRFGAVAFKDNCAYRRSLDFGNPPKEEAEKVFKWLQNNPDRILTSPHKAKQLSDYLFHEFMGIAREFDLPVQIHTGHLAETTYINDIRKANAIHLTELIDLHSEVKFDLFHANWPYSGEVLFLAKNYPNVTIDFCWTNIIDPIYCQRLFKQALATVPHGKIHGYGSDYDGSPDKVWAHASLARDNIAIALSEMVEMDYIGLNEAKQIAYDWLFGNANDFFRLGL